MKVRHTINRKKPPHKPISSISIRRRQRSTASLSSPIGSTVAWQTSLACEPTAWLKKSVLRRRKLKYMSRSYLWIVSGCEARQSNAIYYHLAWSYYHLWVRDDIHTIYITVINSTMIYVLARCRLRSAEPYRARARPIALPALMSSWYAAWWGR